MKRSLKNIKIEVSAHGPLLKRLIKPSDNKGRLVNMNYVWLKKNEKTLPHTHTDSEECFVFLDGKGAITVGNKSIEVKKGDIITVFPGENHIVQNGNESLLRFITFRTLLK